MANASSASTVRKRKDSPSLQEQANGHTIPNGSMTPTKPASSPVTPAESTSVIDIVKIWAPTLILVFGGCCSNVYTLESLIQASPSSGAIITASQFLLTSLLTLPSHLSLSRGWRNLYLKERSIPITKWIIYTVFFLIVNNLNNAAFNYRISVPLHIILRSAGPVSTMIVGCVVAGHRYPFQKILAVALLFLGVVVAALSDSQAKEASTNLNTNEAKDSSTLLVQTAGFALLASALFLSAFMGLYTDNLFNTYGRADEVTSESLFYSHALSLTYFAGTISTLRPQLSTLISTSPPLSTTLMSTSSTSPVPEFLSQFPHALLMLILNAATQSICIQGVNRLAAKSSSLTVSITLNIRKLVSLVLSIWLFGNHLPMGVIVGAGLVFAGGGLYAVPSRGGKGERSIDEKDGKKEL